MAFAANIVSKAWFVASGLQGPLMDCGIPESAVNAPCGYISAVLACSAFVFGGMLSNTPVQMIAPSSRSCTRMPGSINP